MKKRYWHYTVYRTLPEIFNSEAIKTTRIGVDAGIKPAVWFSTNSEWEETARKKFCDTETGAETELLARDGLSEMGEPPVRIQVDPKAANLRSWNNYKKNSGDHPRLLKELGRLAKRWGASPIEWFVSYKDVPVDCFLSIEIWNGQEWVDLKSLGEAEVIELQKPKKERP